VPVGEQRRDEVVVLVDDLGGDVVGVLDGEADREAVEAPVAVGREEPPRLELLDDPRLMETDAGDWTDRSFAEVQAEDPERFAAFVAGDRGFAFPGGESFAAQQDRVCAALDDIRTAGPLPALVICHRNSMRLALERLRGRTVALDDVPNGALVEL
jgi:broad specificity phosphatase PhoE